MHLLRALFSAVRDHAQAQWMHLQGFAKAIASQSASILILLQNTHIRRVFQAMLFLPQNCAI